MEVQRHHRVEAQPCGGSHLAKHNACNLIYERCDSRKGRHASLVVADTAAAVMVNYPFCEEKQVTKSHPHIQTYTQISRIKETAYVGEAPIYPIDR